MIKPTSKIEFEKTNDFFVWSKHTFYDTRFETATPQIRKQYWKLNIQWQNIWVRIKNLFTPPTVALSPYQTYHYQRGAVSLVGSPYLNDDWVAIGDAEQTGTHNTISTITISGVDATGADILVARLSCDTNGKTISSTYAGAALTELVSITTNRASYIQYKGSPATGSNTFVATFSTADNGFGVITTYSGTAGTMSDGQSSATSGTSVSKTITTTNGDMAVDCLCIGTAASAVTIGGGQTQRGSNTSDGWYHEFRASDEAASGSSVTMSWSWTGSANFAYTAGNINQSTGTSFTPRVSFIM